MNVVVRQTHLIGNELILDSVSGEGTHAVVFEDDGSAGYFYALDCSGSQQKIQTAVMIYEAGLATDTATGAAVLFQIRWFANGLSAALLVNGHAHAVLDFSTKCAYGRSCFPRSSGDWTHELLTTSMQELLA